jgi:hypothetical protein
VQKPADIRVPRLRGKRLDLGVGQRELICCIAMARGVLVPMIFARGRNQGASQRLLDVVQGILDVTPRELCRRAARVAVTAVSMTTEHLIRESVPMPCSGLSVVPLAEILRNAWHPLAHRQTLPRLAKGRPSSISSRPVASLRAT